MGIFDYSLIGGENSEVREQKLGERRWLRKMLAASMTATIRTTSSRSLALPKHSWPLHLRHR